MKRYRNFILRAVNLLLVAVLLVQYQHIAVARAATVAQREQQIAEVESWNASVLQAEKAEETVAAVITENAETAADDSTLSLDAEEKAEAIVAQSEAEEKTEIYEAVAETLSAARRAGINKIGFVTQPGS